MENSIVVPEEGHVVLPPIVEGLILTICREQKQPPLSNSTRQELANKGEEESLRILEYIRTKTIQFSFEGFVKTLLRKESDNKSTPLKRASHSSSSNHSSSPFSSPVKTCGLTMNPQQGGDTIPAPSTPLLNASTNVGREEAFSPQLVALGELEFRKAFLILSYIGSNKLEAVITADEIQKLKNCGMIEFEEKVWNSLGKYHTPTERFKYLEWDSGKTYEYHCHVFEDGSLRFKGPYLDATRTHLQRVLGDDNVLVVKVADIAHGACSTGKDHYLEYKKIAKQGILVGLRRYRFFVFKDGGKEAKRKEKTISSIKCIFVRFESNASIDDGKDYVLSGKTIKEARSVFMHVHTLSNGAKYMARFSLILSKTMRLDVDLAGVKVKQIEDIPCQDEDKNIICNTNGEPCIHTDGTGYISEDLALECPKNVFKGRIANGDHIEGKFPNVKSTESHHKVPPLLIQFRLFNDGYAVKGTALVNKQLPRKTIQIRRSMIKVWPDPLLSNICTRNSLEVVTTSNQPKKTSLSRNLIMLLSHGGVPDDFFMEILKNALDESQGVFSNKKTALKVAHNRASMDDLVAEKMILNGIPLEESFLQYRMSIMLNEERKGLLGGRLPISESYYLMGTVDPSRVLESDEVCIILDNGQISGKVLVYRQPGVHFGDVHVLNARYVEALNKYVGHAKYAIFFPCKGPRSLADEMGGGDFDGDMYFVSRNPQLLDYFKVSEPWLESCSTSEVSLKGPCEFSEEEWESELFELFLRTRFQPSYAMGIASNNWTAIMDRYLTMEDSNSEEKGLMKKNLLRLINLYYEALDAPKTGKKIEIPEDLSVTVFPHYMEKENSFKSTSILGKIYDYVKTYGEEVARKEVRKLPCFDIEFPEECRRKWTLLYDQYKREMVDALNCTGATKKDQACNAVYEKYRRILNEATGFEMTERPLDEKHKTTQEQVHNEAIAIYNICYDYAIERNDVGKCGFAWRVAGPALFSFYALKKGESLSSYLPSVVGELFPSR